jgi:hypothetical protein
VKLLQNHYKILLLQNIFVSYIAYFFFFPIAIEFFAKYDRELRKKRQGKVFVKKNTNDGRNVEKLGNKGKWHKSAVLRSRF